MGKGGSERRLAAGFNWGELLFRIFQESGNTEEMRSLAKSFLFGGDIAYSDILKASYEETAWRAVVDGLLDELEAGQDTGYPSNPFPELLKREKRFHRLLSFVQRGPYQVRRFLPTFQAEVFALYRQIILERGGEAVSCGEYCSLASLVKELVSIGGTAIAQEWVLTLEPRCKKRPAHRRQGEGDELRKLRLLQKRALPTTTEGVTEFAYMDTLLSQVLLY